MNDIREARIEDVLYSFANTDLLALPGEAVTPEAFTDMNVKYRQTIGKRRYAALNL